MNGSDNKVSAFYKDKTAYKNCYYINCNHIYLLLMKNDFPNSIKISLNIPRLIKIIQSFKYKGTTLKRFSKNGTYKAIKNINQPNIILAFKNALLKGLYCQRAFFRFLQART